MADDRPPTKIDVAYEDDTIFRLSLNDIGDTNTVFCWPSVGSINFAPRVAPMELDVFSLSLFTPFLRPEPDSNNAATENAFCRHLRLLGAEWHKDYWDYLGAHEILFRPTTPDEDEILHLGWLENGKGVWVLKQKTGMMFGKGCGGCEILIRRMKGVKLWRWRERSF